MTMYKLYDTRTGIYLHDPKLTLTCDFIFDERTSHIHNIVSSRNRARPLPLADCIAACKKDPHLAYVTEPLIN